MLCHTTDQSVLGFPIGWMALEGFIEFCMSVVVGHRHLGLELDFKVDTAPSRPVAATSGWLWIRA